MALIPGGEGGSALTARVADLNLTAILHWSEHTYAWIGEDQNATTDQLPDFVVRHFTEDVPALVVRIQHLTAELAAANQIPDVLTKEKRGADRG